MPVRRNESEALINLLRDSGSLQAARDVIEMAKVSLEGFVAHSSNVFTFHNVRIVMSLQMYAEREVHALTIANRLGLKAAPTLVDHINLGGGESIVITSAAGGDSARIRALNSAGIAVTPGAREQFITDMRSLAASGYHLPEAAKGTREWSINTATGDIMLPFWSRMMPLPAAGASKYLERLEKLADRFLS
jgi:hypothetical protein